MPSYLRWAKWLGNRIAFNAAWVCGVSLESRVPLQPLLAPQPGTTLFQRSNVPLVLVRRLVVGDGFLKRLKLDVTNLLTYPRYLPTYLARETVVVVVVVVMVLLLLLLLSGIPPFKLDT